MSESAKYRQIVESNMFQGFSLEQLESQIQNRLLDQGVDISKFSEKSFPTLVKKLVRFLVEYDIDYKRFVYEIEHPESPTQDLLLKGLCLVDMWIEATKSIQETKSLKNYKRLRSTIDRFKFLCIVDDPETQKYTQLSKKVLDKSKNGSTVARLFDPQPSTSKDIYEDACYRLAKEHVDIQKTVFLNKYILQVVPELRKILENYGKSNEPRELPFKINVLNLTSEELKSYPLVKGITVDFQAFCLYNCDEEVAGIYIAHDLLNFRAAVEHEVVHSVSLNNGQGLTNGIGGRMSRGPNEAITETLTSRPLSYPYPRYILGKILEGKPELEQLVYKAYFGLEPREKLTVALFNLCGSKAVMMWDFMMSKPSELNGSIGKRILFNFEECLQFFTQGIDDISLKAIQQTKQALEKLRSKYFFFTKQTKFANDLYTNLKKNSIEIEENLLYCLMYLEEVPIKDCLDSGLIDVYSIIIQKINSLEFVENESIVRVLTELNIETSFLKTEIINGYKKYWGKNNEPPIFAQEISIS